MPTIKKLSLSSVMLFVSIFFVFCNNASAFSQQIVLNSGWNIVSTPRLLDSHSFSLPENLNNFSIFILDASRPSGWATMADLAQAEFTPLYGYFINNKSTTTQTLTFNYKASTTPNERLFTRTYSGAGWYSFGVANPSYAKPQGSSVVDTNNPDHILNSLLSNTSNYDSVIDFTDASFGFNPDSVGLKDPWKLAVRSADVTNTIEINTINDLRETKGYAIYIKSPTSLNGFQNDSATVTPVTTADFSGGTLPTVGNYDATSSVVVWQKTLAIGSRSAVLSSMRLYASGTVSLGDISNLKLYIDNIQYGTTVASVSAGGYPTFATPTIIAPGLHVIKMTANISGGGKVFSFALQQLSDISLSDGVNFAPVIPSVSSLPFSPIISGPITINQPVFGTLTLTKYSAYANQTVITPQAAYKLGEYRLTTGASDNFTLIDLGLYISGSTSTLANISNIYLVVGTTTSNIVATSSGYTLWFANMPLPQNSPISIAIYATLSGAMAPGATTTSSLLVEAISANTGNPVVTPVILGQTVTTGSGSITAALDASTPVSALVVANTMPKVGSFKFAAQNDSYTIDELTANVSSIKDATAIIELVFKDGATELRRQAFSGNIATATGLTISIPSNSSKIIDVYANLGAIGTGSASTSARVGLTLSGYEAINSNGVKSRYYPNISGNQMYAYKTKPTITNVALPTTVLNNGTQSIYQFMVTADAGGTVAWRTIKFNIATSTASVTSFNLYDSSNQSTTLSNTTCAYGGSTVTCTSSTDQEISGSKTYVLKAIIAGAVVGASVSVNIANSGASFAASTDGAAVAGSPTFLWSDESSQPHSYTTQDWDNDFLVRNLPTDSLTMTK